MSMSRSLLVLVLGLCLVAAAAAASSSSMEHTMKATWKKMAVPTTSASSAFSTQATTCGNLVCLASGADCTSTDVQSECIETEYKSYNANGTCTCTPWTSAPALGSACSPSGNEGTCGPDQIRSCLQNITTGAFQCFGRKLVGDSCSSSLECTPPRACISGVCSADLALGAACRDAFSVQLGFCPLTAYCPFESSAVCTARGSVGAPCPCLPNLVCEPGKQVCEAIQFGYIASGQVANATYQCGSGVWNETSKICLDYGEQKTVFKANYAGVACDTSISSQSQCGTLGNCACGRATSGGNTARCEFSGRVVPSLWIQFTSLIYSYDRSTCEGLEPMGARFAKDTGYCSVTSGFMGAYVNFICTNYASIYSESTDHLECLTIWTPANVCGFNSSTGGGASASTGSSRTSSGTNAAPARAAASVASVLVLLAAVVASLA